MENSLEASSAAGYRDEGNAKDARFSSQLHRRLKDKEEARICVALYKREFTCTCEDWLCGDGTAKELVPTSMHAMSGKNIIWHSRVETDAGAHGPQPDGGQGVEARAEHIPGQRNR